MTDILTETGIETRGDMAVPMTGRILTPELRSRYCVVGFAPLPDGAPAAACRLEAWQADCIYCLVERPGSPVRPAAATGATDDIAECPEGVAEEWGYSPMEWYPMNVAPLVHVPKTDAPGDSREEAERMPEPHADQDAVDGDLEILVDFLNCELAVSHGYDQALRGLADDPCAADLELCRASHVIRSMQLQELIVSLGGDQVEEVTGWRSVACLFGTDDEPSGRTAMVNALAEREEALCAVYLADVGGLSECCRRLVRQMTGSEQHRTHAIMRRMVRWVAHAGNSHPEGS